MAIMLFDENNQEKLILDNYTREVQVDGTDVYTAYALCGTALATAGWRAMKVDENGTKTWADCGRFTQVATDLTALAYWPVPLVTLLASWTITTVTTPDTYSLTIGTVTEDVVFDWGDGSALETFSTGGVKSHVYATMGNYLISIVGGVVDRLRLGGQGTMLKSVDTPFSIDLGLTSGLSMFNYANVSFVENFIDAASANLTTMKSMFAQTTNFVEDLSGLDVGKVTDMTQAFEISGFRSAVSGWDVSKVTSMDRMLSGAYAFNSDLSAWDTGLVENMNNMLRSATSFDQSLAAWDITALTTAVDFMAYGAGISTPNYDATLISWAAQAIVNAVSIDFGSSKYTAGGAAEAARDVLTDTYSWVILDGGSA